MVYTLHSSFAGRLFRNKKDFIQDLHFSVSGVERVRFNGDLSELLDKDTIRVAIIGTRDIDAKAKNHVRLIVNSLKDAAAKSGKQLLIVSGLAVGVDYEAHKTSLDCGVPTVAVLPTGLDNIYPNAHRGIAEKMTETPGCGLLTQFEDGTAPVALNFLDRNATIALISDIVIVVASKAKGGAMVTAKLACSFGSRVYAVPGDLDDVRRIGCNELIRKGDAKMLPRWEDLLEVIKQ